MPTSVYSIDESTKTFATYKQLADFAQPEYFGAKGDGITDDWLAIQKCIDRFNYCHLNQKTYAGNNRVIVNRGTIFEGEGNSSVLKFKNFATGIVEQLGFAAALLKRQGIQ